MANDVLFQNFHMIYDDFFLFFSIFFPNIILDRLGKQYKLFKLLKRALINDVKFPVEPAGKTFG